MSYTTTTHNRTDQRGDDRHHDIQKYRHPMIFPGIAGAAVVSVLLMYVLELAFN
ncbi:hypothetical protein [Falsiroseomonas sp. E2-1-a20]|uniref:hypothetical protein n=1 Tax=Falsiroseomonas sp. E2-1-a20 TaxID=3239300 RepID=UPI003F369017